MAYTFRGGIHVNEHKYTCDCPVEILPEPAVVKISMNQNIGADCTPTVKKGDRVLVGQLIGDVPEGALGCPIHSSVSGTVADIEEQRVPTGAIEKVVVIENDGMGEVSDTVTPYTGSIRDLSPEEITEKIRRAGIAGMGGAAFPTYAKINSSRGKAEYLIVNCAECEPFITADHRLLLEHPEDVVRGVKILMRAVGAPQAFIAVEDNKLNTVKRLRELCGNDGLISVKVLKTKYPQGDERQLIFALTGRELPPGKLPADAGCVIFNAHTCASSYTAISTGMPSVRRIITLSGDCVATPKNLSVPVGASAMDLVAFCGGLVKTPEKMISGGPMMGQAQWNGEMPVKKSTSSVLLSFCLSLLHTGAFRADVILRYADILHDFHLSGAVVGAGAAFHTAHSSVFLCACHIVMLNELSYICRHQVHWAVCDTSAAADAHGGNGRLL